MFEFRDASSIGLFMEHTGTVCEHGGYVNAHVWRVENKRSYEMV